VGFYSDTILCNEVVDTVLLDFINTPLLTREEDTKVSYESLIVAHFKGTVEENTLCILCRERVYIDILSFLAGYLPDDEEFRYRGFTSFSESNPSALSHFTIY